MKKASVKTDTPITMDIIDQVSRCTGLKCRRELLQAIHHLNFHITVPIDTGFVNIKLAMGIMASFQPLRRQGDETGRREDCVFESVSHN
jgi:hypothetical protein